VEVRKLNGKYSYLFSFDNFSSPFNFHFETPLNTMASTMQEKEKKWIKELTIWQNSKKKEQDRKWWHQIEKFRLFSDGGVNNGR